MSAVRSCVSSAMVFSALCVAACAVSVESQADDVVVPPAPPPDCFGGTGCPECAAGQTECANGVARECDPTGRWRTFPCDALQGMECRADGCAGACAPSTLGPSNVGCDYWPTVNANGVQASLFHFAVGIANTGDMPARITVTRGAQQIDAVVVAPGSATVVKLPWVEELKGPDVGFGGGVVPIGQSTIARGGAYRLRSTRPVTVYQFNALEYVAPATAGCAVPGPGGECLSFSNDASLLLPSNALASDYVISGPRSWLFSTTRIGDHAAIVATRDGTVVTVTPRAPTLAGPGVPWLDRGERRSFELNAGDVLQLVARGYSNEESLSGSLVVSQLDHPVQIVSGIQCRYVPDDKGACDHLEESVLPYQSLGDEYVLVAPQAPGATGKKLQTLRLQALAKAVNVAFDPAVRAPALIAPGETLEVASVPVDVRIKGDAPFSVSQYMHGAEVAGAGDPSQSVGVPTAQFRTDYVFVAPEDYLTNVVDIVAPDDAVVRVDGVEIPRADFARIGGSAFSAARRELAKTTQHRVVATKPVGVFVSGYGSSTSYMYPAGLEVKAITPPPLR